MKKQQYSSSMQLFTFLALVATASRANAFFMHASYVASKPALRLFSKADTNASLDSMAENLDSAFCMCKDTLAKTCKVTVGKSQTTGRLGLLATKPIKKDEVVLAMPYEDNTMLTADLARNTVYKGLLPKKFEGWTGDTGLIALMILNEVARATSKGIAIPQREEDIESFMKSWVSSLPSPEEMKRIHPLMWQEEDQEVLESSSTNKVYRILDDIEEDAGWFCEHFFNDCEKFPETVIWNGATVGCFTAAGFQWAMALAQSRSVFVDGCLRIVPFLDICNHSDDGKEIKGGYMGNFGTVKGCQIVASQSYSVGDEVFCSYGPKSAADYLLEHGFCPPMCLKTAVSELTFEIEPKDRFYDDKLDILEFETYDQAPMDPCQSFDVISAPGRDGEPDPAMMQFLRLCKLGARDAFLLESIFRKEVWGFMSMPVSEGNELNVVNAISDACQHAIEELEQGRDGGPEVCAHLRASEIRALSRTLGYLQREKEALDLKEYYQERRLKDLGLDSEWAPEDDISPDLGYGQTRVPGGADYDW